MDTLDLQTFASVARLGAMKRAAIELRTVQSNVTTRIQGLEAELGVQLFVRTSRGVRLTSAGECLMPFALEAARILDEAQSALKDRQDTELRVGGPEVLAAPLMPFGLEPLSKRYPKMEFSWLTGNRASLFSRVASRELDAALSFGMPVETGLSYEAILHQDMYLVGRDPLIFTDESFQRASARIILPDEDLVPREKLTRWALQQKIEKPIVMVVASGASALSCVEQGLGLTVLPAVAVKWSTARFRFHTLKLPRDFDVTMGVVARCTQPRPPALAEFINGIVERAGGSTRVQSAAMGMDKCSAAIQECV